MPVEGRPVALPIETERLLLRPFEPRDLDSLLSIHGDVGLVQWIPWDARSADQIRAVLDRKIGQTQFTDPGGGVALAMEVRESGEFAGELTLSYSSREHSLGEVGFMLRREQQGRGYATEGAWEMLRIAFEELDLHRVIGRIDARNGASGKVLERLGMRREAHLIDNEWIKGEWTSEVAYAILEREWAERA
jgi:RimJ/RimL family protein N-acetyltransferase